MPLAPSSLSSGLPGSHAHVFTYCNVDLAHSLFITKRCMGTNTRMMIVSTDTSFVRDTMKMIVVTMICAIGIEIDSNGSHANKGACHE